MHPQNKMPGSDPFSFYFYFFTLKGAPAPPFYFCTPDGGYIYIYLSKKQKKGAVNSWIYLSTKNTASLVSQGAALSLSSWFFERHRARCGAGLLLLVWFLVFGSGLWAPVSTFLPDKLNEASKPMKEANSFTESNIDFIFFDCHSLIHFP
jgi:hypothetical protein